MARYERKPWRDIKPGMLVMVGVVPVDADIGIGTWQRGGQTLQALQAGQIERRCVVLTVTSSLITCAYATTLGGSATLKGTVRYESERYWVPVEPAPPEDGLHRPIRKDVVADTKASWINTRAALWLEHRDWKELTVITNERYSINAVETIRQAIIRNH